MAWQSNRISIGVGYTIALLITQFGTLLVYGEFASGFMPAMVVLAAVIGGVYFGIKRAECEKVRIVVIK